MNAISKIVLASAFTVLAAAPALAQEAHHGSHGAAPKAGHAGHAGHDAGAAVQLADGEIKKVDKEAGKLTIRHGELKNLGMSPMTMVFRVKDPAMLDQVKAGDKVRFAAERVNGAITVVQLATAK